MVVFPVRLFATMSVLLVGTATSNAAFADIYSGITWGYSNSESQIDAQTISAHPMLMQVQVGHFFNDNFALEGRYGQSIERTGGIAIDNIASLLIKGNVPVTERTAIYGLTGYSYSSFDMINKPSSSTGDISFGLGIHYALSSKSAVTFEIVNYTMEAENRLSSFNLGYQVRF